MFQMRCNQSRLSLRESSVKLDRVRILSTVRIAIGRSTALATFAERKATMDHDQHLFYNSSFAE